MSAIDLHMHSDYSDGELAPATLMQKAHDSGLKIVSLTDHDTIDGLPEAETRARELGLTFVPGVELTVHFEDANIHVLGYFFNPNDPGLATLLTRERNERVTKIRRMVQTINDRLTEEGKPHLDAEAIIKKKTRGVIGRPHIALEMVAQGLSSGVDAALKKYLAHLKAPYYAPDPETAFSILHKAGGIAVLAHPGGEVSSFRGYEEPERLQKIKALKELGLDGIEAYYLQHSPDETHWFHATADSLGLIITTGEDFHGPYSEKFTTMGTLTIPHEVQERIRILVQNRAVQHG